MDWILCIVVFAYAIWAYYSGWKLLTGRWEFLDRKAVPNFLLKAFLSIMVGSFYGAIYAVLLIIKLITSFW